MSVSSKKGKRCTELGMDKDQVKMFVFGMKMERKTYKRRELLRVYIRTSRRLSFYRGGFLIFGLNLGKIQGESRLQGTI